MVLKGCFYVGTSLHKLHLPNVFGARAGFDADASHLFPQDVLAAVNLIVGVVDVGGARACTGCEVRLALCSVAVTVLSEVGSALTLLEQNT